MNQINNPEHFFNIQNNFPSVPFTQSEGWYKYLKSKDRIIAFFVDDLLDAKIACWGREYKIPFTRNKLLYIDGECYKTTISEEEIKAFYSDLTKLPYWGIEVNSNNRYNINYEIGIRRAGFLRPIISYSCPLTIEIDLGADFNFNRNWHRNIKKAIDAQLVFSEMIVVDPLLLEGIVQIFGEMSDLKKLKYKLESTSLSNLVSSADIRTFLVRSKSGRIISARIIHEYKGILSDVFAANSNEGRNCGASYFLMDSLLKLFKEEEKLKFDFSRIPPSKTRTDSVYVFKNATRGRKIQYNGEWVYFNKKRIEFAMVFYKHMIIKGHRY